jgi:hypothetical protein
MVAAIVAVLIVFAVVLLRPQHIECDNQDFGIGVPRMLGAVAFLACAVFSLPGTFRTQSADVAPRLEVPGISNDEDLNWHLEYEKAWKEAVANDRLIFIFVTAVTDTNARYCEKQVFALPEVRTELRKCVGVKHYIDLVPDRKLSTEESRLRAERNARWSQLILHDATEPACIVFKPAADSPFENGAPKGTVLAKHLGIIWDAPEFASLVRDAVRKSQR